MISFAAVPPRFRTPFPDEDEDGLQDDRQNKQRRSDEEDAGVPDGPRGKIGEQRSDESARSSARRDHREKSLRLSGIEKLNQEAPKNGDKEEAEDADEDVEKLGDGYTLRLGLQDAANDCERERHEAVNEREKNAPLDFCDD